MNIQYVLFLRIAFVAILERNECNRCYLGVLDFAVPLSHAKIFSDFAMVAQL